MAGLLIMLVTLCVGYVVADKEIVYLPPDKLTIVLQSAMLCIGETGVSADVLIEYRSGKEFGTDKTFQKFINCILSKSGYADESGHIKIEKALEIFPKNVDKDSIRKVILECNRENGSDPAETSFKFAKCFRQKAPVKIVI
ncbi:hypothetical protein ACJJTC_010227 [Scirpophaga incertulas]